jgi:hypothetical protein
MKMYYFSVGKDWDNEYCVMADSKEEAFEFLENHVAESYYGNLEFWRKNPDLVIEVGKGEVIQTERS